MFIAVLYAIAKKWKWPKSTLMREWINRMGSSHVVEYYLAFKKNEILTGATTWMNLEGIMLNEIDQTRDNK